MTITSQEEEEADEEFNTETFVGKDTETDTLKCKYSKQTNLSVQTTLEG